MRSVHTHLRIIAKRGQWWGLCVALFALVGDASAQQFGGLTAAQLGNPAVHSAISQRALLGMPQLKIPQAAEELRQNPWQHLSAPNADVVASRFGMEQYAISPAQNVEPIGASFTALPITGQLMAAAKKNEFDVNAVYPPVVGAWHNDFSPTPVPVDSLNYSAQELSLIHI